MFNQKVNGYTSQNDPQENYSLGAPYIRPQVIHNCGTTIQKYQKQGKCNGLPLQTWCSPEVAVQSFAMRPIVNSKEYFENIKEYLAKIVLADSDKLKSSQLTTENYRIINDFSREPLNSLLEAINIETTNKLSFLLAKATDDLKMFSQLNPIAEGLVITDIDINNYRSLSNENHYCQQVSFSAVNTTRYNTITFKAVVYVDTTPMMNVWNDSINTVMASKNPVFINNNANPIIYIGKLDLLNDTTCVLGQESECQYSGFNVTSGKSSFSQLLNDSLLAQPTPISWLQDPALINNTYTNQGNYDSDGQIRIKDSGPQNIDALMKRLGY